MIHFYRFYLQKTQILFQLLTDDTHEQVVSSKIMILFQLLIDENTFMTTPTWKVLNKEQPRISMEQFTGLVCLITTVCYSSHELTLTSALLSKFNLWLFFPHIIHSLIHISNTFIFVHSAQRNGKLKCVGNLFYNYKSRS